MIHLPSDIKTLTGDWFKKHSSWQASVFENKQSYVSWDLTGQRTWILPISLQLCWTTLQGALTFTAIQGSDGMKTWQTQMLDGRFPLITVIVAKVCGGLLWGWASLWVYKKSFKRHTGIWKIIKVYSRMIIWQLYKAIKQLLLLTANKVAAHSSKPVLMELLFAHLFLSVCREAGCVTHQRKHTNHPLHTHTQLHPHQLYNNPPECESCGLKWKNGSKSENRKSQTGYSSLPTITARIHVQAHVCMHTQAEPSSSYSHQW